MTLAELYKQQTKLIEERRQLSETLHVVAQQIHVLETKEWAERLGLSDGAIIALQGVPSGSKVGTPGA